VQVQPGQTLQFPVTLEPTGGSDVVAGTNEPAPTAGATGSFTLETTPPGAKVFLDGQELGGVTPLRIGNLLAKRYALKLQLADYREQSVPVDVKPGQDLALPRVVMQPERVHVRVVSEPSGADVSVARGAERRALGRSPVDVTLDNDGEPWTVEVNKAGFEPFIQPVDTSTGQREIAVKANLARTGGAPVVTAPVREPVAQRDPPAPREPAAPREPKAPKPAKEPVVASSGGGNGTLRINSRPWSQVIIDGRSIGSTPQMNVSLPAGTHKIMLVNPEFDIKKTLTVKIKAGQVETQIVTLQ
jgi:serine/threonine-protein kinase